jgi:5'-nucleotidase
MRTKPAISLAVAILTVLASNASAQGESGHSLEADQHDERVDGPQARTRASEPVRWHDPAGRHDPTISVKLLGINDFHGQLSPRTLGPPTALRPVGGAAVLASYLEAAADETGRGKIGRDHHDLGR